MKSATEKANTAHNTDLSPSVQMCADEKGVRHLAPAARHTFLLTGDPPAQSCTQRHGKQDFLPPHRAKGTAAIKRTSRGVYKWDKRVNCFSRVTAGPSS